MANHQNLQEIVEIDQMDARIQQRIPKERKIHSKDLRIHHRISATEKHLFQGKGNLMEQTIN